MGGFALGSAGQRAAERGGYRVVGYVWRHPYAGRAPYLPHLALAGVHASSPYDFTQTPQSHRGCLCFLEPVFSRG